MINLKKYHLVSLDSTHKSLSFSKNIILDFSKHESVIIIDNSVFFESDLNSEDVFDIILRDSHIGYNFILIEIQSGITFTFISNDTTNKNPKLKQLYEKKYMDPVLESKTSEPELCLNDILDKISLTGIKSLSPQEKEYLNKQSQDANTSK